MEGDNTTLVCNAVFGGEITPNVTFREGDESLQSDLTKPSRTQVTAEAKLTVSAEDDGKEYNCHISVEQPSFADNCTVTLSVQCELFFLTFLAYSWQGFLQARRGFFWWGGGGAAPKMSYSPFSDFDIIF